MKQFTVDELTVTVWADAATAARQAAQQAAARLQAAIAQRGAAAAIFATGQTQIPLLAALTATPGLDWSRITGFHLDEYLGLAADHPASFRRYLRDHLTRRVTCQAFHWLEGDCPQPLAECDHYTQLLQAQPLDLCCLGIGENGHLAFNEPHLADPADPYWVKLVKLEARNRQQQVRQGWFPSLAAVPSYAFTLTLPAIARARYPLGLALGSRKAAVVQALLYGPISAACPASFLRQQVGAELHLDQAAWTPAP